MQSGAKIEDSLETSRSSHGKLLEIEIGLKRRCCKCYVCKKQLQTPIPQQDLHMNLFIRAYVGVESPSRVKAVSCRVLRSLLQRLIQLKSFEQADVSTILLLIRPTVLNCGMIRCKKVLFYLVSLAGKGGQLRLSIACKLMSLIAFRCKRQHSNHYNCTYEIFSQGAFMRSVMKSFSNGSSLKESFWPQCGKSNQQDTLSPKAHGQPRKPLVYGGLEEARPLGCPAHLSFSGTLLISQVPH